MESSDFGDHSRFMKLLIDEQLPPKLKAWFSQQGLETNHVFDVGLKSALDVEIAEYAASNRLILVSKDDDFVEIARRLAIQLVLIKCGNLTTARLMTFLDDRWGDTGLRLQEGTALVIVQ